MASLTFAQLMTRVRYYVNDTGVGQDGRNGITWNDIEVMMAINDAIRDSWDSFWFEVWDEFSYTGFSAVAQDTNEIAIPTAYSYDSWYGQNLAAPGEILSIWTRPYFGTTSSPVPYPWQQVKSGLRVDDPRAVVNTNTPKIRFSPPYNQSFEMRLYGRRPILAQPAWNYTSDNTSVITVTDAPAGTGLEINTNDTVIFFGAVSLGMSPVNTYYVSNITPGSYVTFKIRDTPTGPDKVLTSSGSGNFFITSMAIPGSGYTGLINFLLHKTAEYLHRSRINSNNRENHLAEAQLEQQLADDERKRYKMQPQHQTVFRY